MAAAGALPPPVPPLVAPPPPRSPWQLLYGAAHRWRGAHYRQRARRLPAPVLSVGNLHWGGAGKTPLVAALAAGLRERGRRPAILARGYRGAGGGPVLVSHGSGPLVGAEVGGDEPVMLAAALPGVGVVVGRDRHAAGLHALAEISPPPDLFLLDDGFSHLALRRDLDLLALPAADPFGGGRLPPGGRLREPLAAVARADAVLLTGRVAPGSGAALAEALRPHGFAGPGFASPLVAGAPRGEDGSPLAKGARVLLVAGIARPQAFLEEARAQELSIGGTLFFRDHHPYPARSLGRVEEEAAAVAAEAVVTTAKDAVKLAGRLALPLFVLPVRAEPEPDFWTWLEARLGALGNA